MFAFLSNTINEQTFYYLSGINCFSNENTKEASHFLELRALVLEPHILENLRRFTNWGTSNTLSSFSQSDRLKILKIIYGRNEYGRLAFDWIKLFLLGTENYHVYLVNKRTGKTCEVLFINKADMESYFEVAKIIHKKKLIIFVSFRHRRKTTIMLLRQTEQLRD